MKEFINNNSDNVLLTILAALILSFSLGFYIISKYHIQVMADKGYIEQALPGTTNTVWVKTNEYH